MAVNMRRKDRAITDIRKMMEILKSCDCCRIGLVDKEEAYIVPLNFGYEEQDGNIILYFHCAKEGRKIDLIPKQKMVIFEMDTKHELVKVTSACEFSYLYQCVMGKGEIEILEDNHEKIYGLQKIVSHYSETANLEFQQELVNRVLVLKLTVTEWSCKEH